MKLLSWNVIMKSRIVRLFKVGFTFCKAVDLLSRTFWKMGHTVSVFGLKWILSAKISRIQLTNFKWFVKNQGVKDAKAHHSHENFGASWIVFPMFFGICKIKKIIKERAVL